MRIRLGRAVPHLFVPLYNPARAWPDLTTCVEKLDEPFPVGRYQAVTLGTRYGLHTYVYVWEGINPESAMDELLAGYMRPELKDPYGY